MKILETDRLLLRPFEQTDLEDFNEYAKTPNVGPNAGWPPHDSIEESKKILSTLIEEDEVLAIVWKDNGKVIGSIGLHKDPIRSAQDVKMLGYVLSEDYWGHGIVTEASKAVINYVFQELDVSLVSIHHYPFNQRSKRVIEKCGFTHEGTLRHASTIYNGNTYDIVCYSMTKDEWSILYTKNQVFTNIM